jgi:hypothetical protein
LFEHYHEGMKKNFLSFFKILLNSVTLGNMPSYCKYPSLCILSLPTMYVHYLFKYFCTFLCQRKSCKKNIKTFVPNIGGSRCNIVTFSLIIAYKRVGLPECHEKYIYLLTTFLFPLFFAVFNSYD